MDCPATIKGFVIATIRFGIDDNKNCGKIQQIAKDCAYGRQEKFSANDKEINFLLSKEIQKLHNIMTPFLAFQHRLYLGGREFACIERLLLTSFVPLSGRARSTSSLFPEDFGSFSMFFVRRPFYWSETRDFLFWHFVISMRRVL